MEKQAKEVKKQAVSKSYTLKALKKNVEKLVECGLLEKEDGIKMLEYREKALKKWMKEF